MSNNACAPNESNSPATFERGPAFPKEGSQIIRVLKEAVDRAEFPRGEDLTQQHFGELIGLAKSTVNDWFHDRLVDQIKAFLCGLERLSPQGRADLLSEICRECPRLNDARIAHDSGSVGALTALVQQQAGLTLITSRSDKARTFLITAMGNAANGAVRASGFDLRSPREFVPVSGVLYLSGCSRSAADVRAAIRRLWPVVVDSDARLLIFNGVLTLTPELRPRLAALARTRNVIVADDTTVEHSALQRSPGVTVTQVRVEHVEADPSRLTVQIRA